MAQLSAPKSLTVWLQQAGRAGRSLTIRACAGLLIEVSALKEIWKKACEENLGLEDEGEEDIETKTYWKRIETHLRLYVKTMKCHRDVADKLFDNPPGRGM